MDETSDDRRGIGPIAVAGIASLAAGIIHAVAAGSHAEDRQVARIFVALAVVQIAVGLWALLRQSRPAGGAVAAVSLVAVGGWLVTRLVGIGAIDGLARAEDPQVADTVCAVLALVAAGLSLVAIVAPPFAKVAFPLAASVVLVGAFTIPAMAMATSHSHDHGEVAGDGGHSHDSDGGEVAGQADGAAAAVDDHGHADDDPAHAHTDDTVHDETDDSTHAHAEPVALAWPRAWDPADGIDVSGVEGVTVAQELRATKLIEETLRELPKYADPAAAIADGYVSIGDGVTGTEHFIKSELVEDDVILDARAPESLVYEVKDGQRTLTGAMYIASARPADDPTLTEWAGPLMTWHKHDNLCWALDDQGKAKVVGVIDAEGNCARGTRAGGENPMVHVWITPHPCGVFAALEGIGAGTAAITDANRVDMCEHTHGTGHVIGNDGHAKPKPYDPTKPIDLSGTPGVTEEQQAAAENLIAVTVVRLPKWADYRVAEAAGFRSIGDGVTGHEHYIQWDWINDDVILDPDFPESLVYEPQPDGSKKLVSAMYMLPDTVALTDVPDIGGALMQWHVHDDLCFTNDPVQPRVAGVTAVGGTCPTGLQKFRPSPMIHVWITPHRCGPFAALEGVGAGQIEPGQERLCDHAHGSGGF